ncbi:hypothetical protein D3C80_2116070 [compost metagenome]
MGNRQRDITRGKLTGTDQTFICAAVGSGVNADAPQFLAEILRHQRRGTRAININPLRL